MDIQYLLFLQEFRNSIHDAWTPFMEWISHFAVAYLIVIPAFIYWCMNKKKGLYILTAAGTAIAVNAVIKLTACAYRPWIRDPRVIPAGDAITEATGYSFPSGHTATAVPVYGGIAVTYGKKRKLVAVICIILALITGFSRNYLGVHTPQDVVVGFLVSLVSLYGMGRLFRYLSEHPEKENRFLLAGLIFCMIAIIYITFKPYPMHYVDGQLLVDPQRMMKDGYRDIGMLGAFCIGRYLEKTFIGFKEAGLNLPGILVSLLGIVPLYFISKKLNAPMESLLGPHFGSMIAMAILVIFIITLWPAVIKMVSAFTGKKAEEKNGVKQQ